MSWDEILEGSREVGRMCVISVQIELECLPAEASRFGTAFTASIHGKSNLHRIRDLFESSFQNPIQIFLYEMRWDLVCEWVLGDKTVITVSWNSVVLIMSEQTNEFKRANKLKGLSDDNNDNKLWTQRPENNAEAWKFENAGHHYTALHIILRAHRNRSTRFL